MVRTDPLFLERGLRYFEGVVNLLISEIISTERKVANIGEFSSTEAKLPTAVLDWFSPFNSLSAYKDR